MQRVEHYTDYREFLKDFYEDTKKRFPFFSYRYFCKKAGLSSPSLYRSVVEGKRNLTPKTILSFIQGLGLSDQEGNFSTALVHFNQAKSSREKQKYLEQMRGFLPRIKQSIVPLHQFAYYSKWYNIVIRELACVMNWKEDYAILAKSVYPQIKKSEARQAVDLLLDLGLIKRREDGTYIQTEQHITTGAEVASMAVRNVNEQLAQLGKDSIQTVPPGERDVSSLTIGLSRNAYQVLKHEIQEFKARVIRLVANQEKADQVYNLNVQLFPLSRKTREEAESTAFPVEKEGTR